MSEYLSAERERAVWERVGACQVECGCDTVSPEELCEWAKEKREAAARICRLAGCVRGCARRCLLELAAELCRQARTLAAWYFQMTGKCVPKCENACGCMKCPLEVLRKEHAELCHSSERFWKASKRAHGDLAEMLECMAKDDDQHAKTLICVMACLM